MNYSKNQKPVLVDAPQKIKECNSFYYALILIGLLLKMENDRATNGVMTQQEVKCTTSRIPLLDSFSLLFFYSVLVTNFLGAFLSAS